jgi:hypothetical protein
MCPCRSPPPRLCLQGTGECMDWLYVAATLTAIISGNYYQDCLRNPALMPRYRLPFDTAGAVAGTGFLGLLISGFFIGPWWQPFACLGLGVAGTGLATALLPRDLNPGWVVLFALASVVLTVALLLRVWGLRAAIRKPDSRHNLRSVCMTSQPLGVECMQCRHRAALAHDKIGAHSGNNGIIVPA